MGKEVKPIGKKVLFIGDIHGCPDWLELATNGIKQFYTIVFLGDYVDSYHIPAVEQLDNLKNIIAFLKKHKSQTTALFGNHDYAYIMGYSGISGYQYEHAHEYQKLFRDNLDLFQVAWGYTNPNTQKYTLATHAGLTQSFWNKWVKPEFSEGGWLHQITEGKTSEQIQPHEALNFLRDKGDILWRVGPMRGGYGTPGPLWADYRELLEDPYENINHVFGHTPKVSPSIDHIGNDFYACIDSRGNMKCTSMIITL